MDKAPEAFRTISEVAVELDVPQHVLRFWETKFPHVKPMKRAGGRRYYRPEDIDLLRGIRALLYHSGLTIKGVQKVLRERGLRYVAQFGRIDASPAIGGSNVHLFPGTQQVQPEPALQPEQRQRLESLLGELLELKERLQTSKRR